MITPNLLSLATDTAHLPVRWDLHWHPQPTAGQSLVLEGREKITLRHHRAAFVGCFSLHLKKNIHWDLFKTWKVTRNPSITEEMARDFLPFIRNHYDCITSGMTARLCYEVLVGLGNHVDV